jgi:hypothetical protein
MQTNQATAEQFISNANATNAATENNAATAAKRFTDNLVTGKTKVPLAINIICILGAGGFGLSAVGLLIGWQLIAAVGTPLLICTILSVVANLLAIIWMWQMKKRGAYLYAGMFAVNQIVMLVYGVWAVNIAFLIGVAVTGIALYYSKQMK